MAYETEEDVDLSPRLSELGRSISRIQSQTQSFKER